jgi:hypothetical protein
MKFVVTYSFEPDREKRDEAIARFQRTGGLPPEGARLLGRWTRADFSGGFLLLESDDARALTGFALMWSDLLALSIVPVLEDQELAELLQHMGM